MRLTNRLIYLAKWKCSINAFEAPDGSKRSCILRGLQVLIVVRFVNLSLQCDTGVALLVEKVPCPCVTNPDLKCGRISFTPRCTIALGSLRNPTQNTGKQMSRKKMLLFRMGHVRSSNIIWCFWHFGLAPLSNYGRCYQHRVRIGARYSILSNKTPNYL
jgi:hypothetical protein